MKRSPKEMKTFRGFILFMRSYIGTKSEGVWPFLYSKGEQLMPVCLSGDNPFQNDELRKYDGKFVEIKGLNDDCPRFTIDEISLIFSDENAEVSESTEKNFSAESEKNNEINKENNNTTGEEK